MRMQKALLFCLALCISLVAGVDLSGKTRYWPGLGFNLIDIIVPPSYSYTTQEDQSPCRPDRCTIGIQTVYAISYVGQGTSYACFCNDAVMDIHYMADNIGRVPHPVRAAVSSYTVATAGIGGGADAYGTAVAFYNQNMATEVFIHESAHCFDFANGMLADSNDWHDAETWDTCIPDDYAASDDIENFAQMVVVFTYLTLTSNSYPECMSNQLNYVNWVLPASSIIDTTRTVWTLGGGFWNSCYDIGFDLDTTILYATCYRFDASTNAATINLNECITNSWGVLTQQCNGNFAGSCWDFGVIGTNGWDATHFAPGEILGATCYGFDSTNTNNFLLDFVFNNDGNLYCGC